MKERTWSLLILVGLLVIAGGVLLFKKVTVLHIENMDHPRTVRIRVSPTEPFSVFCIHSIYKEPVVEEFQADGDAVVLKGVRTKSPAVMQYYGFEDMKGFHPMNQRLGAIYFKWGIGEGQGLIVGDRKIYLSGIGERGDRIQLRVESMPLLNYLLSEMFK
ncbi:MAG TPA: hypothetical protein VEK32_14165 [Thermodesulfobacteriota bacterium]|nr:hypothetical protein [Thermodesulfobacteriota bacterium]